MWNRKTVLGWSAVTALLLASAGWAAGGKPKAKIGKTATVAPAMVASTEATSSPENVMNPATPPSDEVLSEQIKAAIKADPLLDGQSIQVEAKAGTVILRGEVASDQQLNHALDLAGAIPGVRAVENAMLVKS